MANKFLIVLICYCKKNSVLLSLSNIDILMDFLGMFLPQFSEEDFWPENLQDS